MSEDQRETITLTRVCNKPIERVFQAWVDPKDTQRWWIPNAEWEIGAAAEGAAVAVTARSLDPHARLPGTLRETVAREGTWVCNVDSGVRGSARHEV